MNFYTDDLTTLIDLGNQHLVLSISVGANEIIDFKGICNILPVVSRVGPSVVGPIIRDKWVVPQCIGRIKSIGETKSRALLNAINEALVQLSEKEVCSSVDEDGCIVYRLIDKKEEKVESYWKLTDKELIVSSIDGYTKNYRIPKKQIDWDSPKVTVYAERPEKKEPPINLEEYQTEVDMYTHGIKIYRKSDFIRSPERIILPN